MWQLFVLSIRVNILCKPYFNQTFCKDIFPLRHYLSCTTLCDGFLIKISDVSKMWSILYFRVILLSDTQVCVARMVLIPSNKHGDHRRNCSSFILQVTTFLCAQSYDVIESTCLPSILKIHVLILHSIFLLMTYGWPLTRKRTWLDLQTVMLLEVSFQGPRFLLLVHSSGSVLNVKVTATSAFFWQF